MLYLRQFSKGGMKFMKRESGMYMNMATKFVLDFMFWSGLPVLAASPFLLHYAGKNFVPLIRDHYPLFTAVYFVSGIAGLYIVYQLRKIMSTVIRKNCFTEENVTGLSRMGKAGLIISAAFLVKETAAGTFAGFVIILVFFIAALFCFVLTGVFAEAVRYKQENDLTI